MKKKIFKYFACMITVAILATTLLLSWVNYEMFKGRVMSDLEAYGRVFAVVLSGSGGERRRAGKPDAGKDPRNACARGWRSGLR